MEWSDYNKIYDDLMAIGDIGKPQQSRIAIALWGMVQTGGDNYLPGDLEVYRNNAMRGQAYLDKHGLPAYPDANEIAEIMRRMDQ